jgi:RNA polymerase sigma-70 factor (family 1)
MGTYGKYLEEELIGLLKQGNQQAYDQIFRKFYPALCFFARRFVSVESTAEEIVQDVLFKLWQKHADFDTILSVKGFLYISTKNACFDRIKKEQRQQHRDHNWYLQYEKFEPAVEQQIIHAEVLLEIQDAIELLPEQCRKIMKMSYEHGMSGKKIADELQITVSTVNNQKARGIALMRKMLSSKGLALFFTICAQDWLRS